ncbi:MAG: hypothetical protein ACRDOL_41015 [Streptosporangiaceae bacterium]
MGHRLALVWPTADDDGAFPCPAGRVPHLVLGDLAVLGLVGGQEVIEGLQPPVVVGLRA